MGSDGWMKYEEEKKRSNTITAPMISLLSTLVVVSILILAILGPYRFSAPGRHPPFIGDHAIHHIPKVLLQGSSPMVIQMCYENTCIPTPR